MRGANSAGEAPVKETTATPEGICLEDAYIFLWERMFFSVAKALPGKLLEVNTDS